MSKPNNNVPQMRLHKASGQAVVYINRREHYLGKHGTAAAKAQYDRLISEWLANGRRIDADDSSGVTVSELLVAYLRHCKAYFNGAGEYGNIVQAIAPLRTLYGRTPAAEFSPLKLKAVRARMIELGWTRESINRKVARVRAFFRWCVGEELLPPSMLDGLQAVRGLAFGHTDAKESEKVRPVPEAWVYATMEHLPKVVATMVEVQLLTGMRSGEVCRMRVADIDMRKTVWIYRPPHHKTLHLGHAREVAIGPKAQALLQPYLSLNTEQYLFRPALAVEEMRAHRSEARTTPGSCGNRPGSNLTADPKRRPSKRYKVTAYRRCVERAARKAFPPPAELARHRIDREDGKDGGRWETRREWQDRLKEKWSELLQWETEHRWHPHQLRHTCATKLRDEHGLEAAQIVLGHRSAVVTQLYAEVNKNKAIDVMGRVG